MEISASEESAGAGTRIPAAIELCDGLAVWVQEAS
jgi:hypothetical protein